VLVQKDEMGCKFIGSSKLVQLLYDILIAGRHDRPLRDFADAAATAAQKESERVSDQDAYSYLCLRFQSREVLFPDWQVRSKRGETAVR